MDESLTLWLLIYPAEDVPGTWIAHWLDNDVMTLGESPAHAYDMAAEALAIWLEDDVAVGRLPPFRRAPEADWRRMEDIVRNGTRAIDLKGAAGDVEIAAMVGVRVRHSTAQLPVRTVAVFSGHEHAALAS